MEKAKERSKNLPEKVVELHKSGKRYQKRSKDLEERQLVYLYFEFSLWGLHLPPTLQKDAHSIQ